MVRPLLDANQAGEDYVRSLSSAYRRFRIEDANFAEINEIEAWDLIRRDPPTGQAIEKRRMAISLPEGIIEPASDMEQDKIGAQITEQLIRPIKRFTDARFMLTEADFRGSSFGFMKGFRKPFDVQVALGKELKTFSFKFWMPNRIVHVDRNRFRYVKDDEASQRVQAVKTKLQMYNIFGEEWQDLENPQWFIQHVMHNTEDTLGYGGGLLSEIFMYWRAKTICIREGLNSLERWAGGVLVGKIDGLRAGSTGETNSKIVSDWLEVLEKMRSRHVNVMDKEDDVQVIDGASSGFNQVEFMLNYLDSGIIRRILNSELPTGGGSDVGSLARAEVEADQAEGTFQFSRRALGETLTDSLIAFTWDRNKFLIEAILKSLGLPMAKMPSYQIRQEEIEDADKIIAQATAMHNIGIDLSVDEILNRAGWGKVDPATEKVLKGMEAAEPGGFGFQDREIARNNIISLFDVDGSNRNGNAAVRNPALVYAECEQGQTEEQTGCTPKEENGNGDNGGEAKKPKKKKKPVSKMTLAESKVALEESKRKNIEAGIALKESQERRDKSRVALEEFTEKIKESKKEKSELQERAEGLEQQVEQAKEEVSEAQERFKKVVKQEEKEERKLDKDQNIRSSYNADIKSSFADFDNDPENPEVMQSANDTLNDGLKQLNKTAERKGVLKNPKVKGLLEDNKAAAEAGDSDIFRQTFLAASTAIKEFQAKSKRSARQSILTYAECEPGETSAKTGCTPKGDDGEEVAKKKLNTEDKGVLTDFTSDPSGRFQEMNKKLRDGEELTGGEEREAERLDNALEKLPDFDGDVHRRLTFNTDEDFNNFLDSFGAENVGDTVQFDSFSSTSKESPITVGGRRVIDMQIKSKTGKDIEQFSENPDETEVLLQRNTELKLTGITKGKFGALTMNLEEV